MVTNNRCVAEQIKSDTVENVATGGVKIEQFGNGGKCENSNNIVMDGIQFGIFGKFENQ